MKKTLILTLTAILILTGCSKEEVSESKEENRTLSEVKDGSEVSTSIEGEGSKSSKLEEAYAESDNSALNAFNEIVSKSFKVADNLAKGKRPSNEQYIKGLSGVVTSISFKELTATSEGGKTTITGSSGVFACRAEIAFNKSSSILSSSCK